MAPEFDTNYVVALLGGIVVVSYFLFIIWMSIDAIKGGKLFWLLAILGVPLIGAVIYFFVEKKREYMKLRIGEDVE